MDSIHYHQGERENLLKFDDEELTDSEVVGWFHRLFDELHKRGLAGRMHELHSQAITIDAPRRRRPEPFEEACPKCDGHGTVVT